MSDDSRLITSYTRAARRPLRFDKTPMGHALPFNPSGPQLVAFVIAVVVFGLPTMVIPVMTVKLIGFGVIPIVVYLAVGTIQDGGSAPAVTAYNTAHRARSWSIRQAGRVQRPKRFEGKTRFLEES